MEKTREVSEVLNFYIRLDKLKNEIINEVNNYSVADHLFGSMILATAIDSEFKETNNLAKVYRMMFLNEFYNYNPDYDMSRLKLGKQYIEEIDEARKMNTEDSLLVFKYRMLDHLLTRLIKEKEDKVSSSELISEGSSIISRLCDREAVECEEIFKFYYLNCRLKNKVRSGWDSKHWNIKTDRIERISEHVIGVFGLALATISEYNYKIDTNKVLKMVVIHETGETLIGDITPFDGITPEQKEEIEHQAMEDALGNLKEKASLLDLLFEFDDHKTLESRCSYKCDKCDADLKSKIYLDSGMHHSLDDQENNVVFKSKKAQKMLSDGAKDAFDIWYQWDKSIYEGDNDFPEFKDILNVARANNLLNLDKVLKERIYLTPEEHTFISQTIANTVKELYDDENIDAVYLTNYQSSEGSKGVLDVVIILKSCANQSIYDELIDELNYEMVEENKTSVGIVFDYDVIDRYSLDSPDLSKYRMELLGESKILFDKSGKISMTQSAMKKTNHEFNFDLVDYVPPVEETISHRLAKVK